MALNSTSVIKIVDLLCEGTIEGIVDGGKNVRLAQLQEMVDSMSSQTTTKKEAKASSTPSKKKASGPAKSGFSVKDFWAEKLNAEVPGATLPR